MRVFFKQFITRIEAGYDQVRIFYRYPIWGFFGYLEEQQSIITPEVAASVFEVAPYLAPCPVYHPPPVLTNPRDVEIYRLHEVPVFFRGYLRKFHDPVVGGRVLTEGEERLGDLYEDEEDGAAAVDNCACNNVEHGTCKDRL